MEKIIHQIWVGPYELPDMEKFFINRVKEFNPDYQHILWTDKNLPPLPPEVQAKVDHWNSQETYAFTADVLRIFLIKEYGGIYADVDWNCHKGFSDLQLENRNGLVVYHNEYTTGNEVFGCAANTGFIEHMYQVLLKTPVHENHMPQWFNQELRVFCGVEDTWNHPGHPHNVTGTRTPEAIEEFEANGKLWLQTLQDRNYLPMRKWGEFENVYLTHRQLHSWDNSNKQKFKEGNINYKDEYCKIEGYNC